MPSGSTHAAITLIAAAGISAYALQHGWDRPAMIAGVGGCLAGILISPDLDVDQPTRPNYVAYRYGILPGVLWRLIWLPYGRAFSHRSIWSHTPGLSTLIRVGYLGAWLWPAWRLLGWPWPPNWPWLPLSIGMLMVSDDLHWAADIIVSAIKRARYHAANHKKRLNAADNG